MKNFNPEIYPVMLTPFKKDGSVDFDGLRKLTEFYIETGSTGLFANCLSSEMFLLSEEERIQVTKTVVEQVSGRQPVIAVGTFGINQQRNVGFIKKIYQTGISAVILNTSQLAAQSENEEAMKRNLEFILEKTDDITLGVYECPEPYKRLLSPEILTWMAKTNRFMFLKETSCNLDEIQLKTDAAKGSKLGIYNANIPTTVESLRIGAAGVATIASNYYPELVHFLVSNVNTKTEKYEYLNEMLTVLDPLIHQVYPLSAKYFLQKRGLEIEIFTRKKLAFSHQDYIKFDKLLKVFKRIAEELEIEIT
jgi:4-hydroxy-tetrahydrodipicolinate synthase